MTVLGRWPAAWMAAGITLAIVADAAPVEAGCGVPEPVLWSPSNQGAVPLDAHVVVSLGGFGGQLRGVELRAIGGRALGVQRRELPGPVGHALLELVPDAPLSANTTYELVARRPEWWHPTQWVFGAFTTGGEPGATAPELRVLAARLLEQVEPEMPPLRWIELDVSSGPSSAAALFAVWLPNDRGTLATAAPPSVYLPREGDTLRISSPELCGGFHVPLPATPGRAEIGVAAIDAAGHAGPIVRVAIDFAHPTRRGTE
ncbi:MAG TPA: hypothetical protein VMG12_27380 [Polyangiaceae bacterium]|nr:hypothetical protein [Polyangiaceae bacterium]